MSQLITDEAVRQAIPLLTITGTYVIIQKLLASGCPSLREEKGGSTLYAWYTSWVNQVIVFPFLILGSLFYELYIYTHEGHTFLEAMQKWGVHEWSEESPGKIFSEYFHFVLLAYLLKDFFFPQSSMLVLHHIVCGISVWASLQGYFHKGHNCFALGSMFLELGSCLFGMTVCFPQDKMVHAVNLHIMTFSNVFGMLSCFWWWCHPEASKYMIAYVCLPALLIGLAIMRQKTLIDIRGEYRSKEKEV